MLRYFKKLNVSKDLLLYVGGILLVLVIGIGNFHAPLARAYEDVAFAVNPSAERAFDYGERHFSATDPAMYDIDRAEYFFEAAAVLDPGIPYLFHELARISFLRGDFNKAMARIDLQIALHGDSAPKAYYVRGLIEGYKGEYAEAARDYEHFLTFDPLSWAAHNDYAWVLLKAGRAPEAVRVTEKGLQYFPENVWLLNTSAIALYETGEYALARERASAASAASEKITRADWLRAYPGNDPRVAQAGISTLQASARDNIHMIEAAYASSTIQ